MWSLIFIVINSANFLGNSYADPVSSSHVDNFISQKLCEEAGNKIIDRFNKVHVQYACVLEIN
jgi:hypothetical protein